MAEGKFEGTGLGGLARLNNQTIQVENHWVLVYLGIMHKVQIRRS